MTLHLHDVTVKAMPLLSYASGEVVALSQEHTSKSPNPVRKTALSSSPKRVAEMRFGRVRWLRGTWGYLSLMDGKIVFAHRDSLLDGRLELGDVVRFVEERGYPHSRAEMIVRLLPSDPVAAAIRTLDAQRVRPRRPLNLKTWPPTPASLGWSES